MRNKYLIGGDRMKRSLEAIQADFAVLNELDEPRRTNGFVRLMNELEADQATFIVNPTAADLARPEVKLYREISDARKL